MKTCEEVMTPDPVCCLPSDRVIKAAQLMEQGNVGSIPVIENDQSRKLIGIITDRDLVLRLVAIGGDAKSVKIEAVMTRMVMACRADDHIQRVLEAMSKYKLRRIVIVDNTNVVLGIISQADVATRVNQPEKTAKMVKDISQADTH